MKKVIQYILYTVALLYLPCLLAMSIFGDQSGSFFVFSIEVLFLLLLLISIHYLCVFLEIGFTVLRFLEKKERTLGEKILNIATAIVCVGLIVAIILVPEFNYTTIILSSLIVLLWIAGDIIFKQKKFTPEIFRKKSFWISTVAIIVVSYLIFALNTEKLWNEGRPDPLETAEIDISQTI